MKNTLLSIGHGYTAQALAKHLPVDQWRIIGTSRSNDFNSLPGIDAMIWPGADLSNAIQSATHLLISIAPNEAGDPVLNKLADQIASAPNLQWVGYLSTTAVYGDHNGGWVDELTPPTPDTKRGKLRARAELDWLNFANDQRFGMQIFRLAGIYGPGRGPFAKVRSGTARRIIKQNQVFSRIHVDDIAQTLIASMANANPGTIYNVCDDLAAPPEDVIEYAANLLELPVPLAEDWETAELSPMARSFYSESKRVRNDRIKDELGISLLYPDYQSGLTSLSDADETD